MILRVLMTWFWGRRTNVDYICSSVYLCDHVPGQIRRKSHVHLWHSEQHKILQGHGRTDYVTSTESSRNVGVLFLSDCWDTEWRRWWAESLGYEIWTLTWSAFCAVVTMWMQRPSWNVCTRVSVIPMRARPCILNRAISHAWTQHSVVMHRGLHQSTPKTTVTEC
jgi:hypothetical protein